ncbi:MAG: flagellar motor protein MotB, partial [Cytophagales bacterium]|nr:flagellar motor protein MotB [Cytophagales bacterium]
DETAASLTTDGKKIYFVQNVTNVSSEGDSISRPKLFSAEWDKTKWGKPKTFILNNLPHSYAHPFVEGNEKMFLFSSDMPGGYGGADIYVSINIDEKWTDPINLGPNINTPGNEIYPYLDTKGTLYFSSDYHLGMGGYDIFKSEQVNGDFDKAQNLLPPFNSHQNDFAFSINHTKGMGFFTSDRFGGKGKEDVYMFNLNKTTRIEAKGK